MLNLLGQIRSLHPCLTSTGHSMFVLWCHLIWCHLWTPSYFQFWIFKMIQWQSLWIPMFFISKLIITFQLVFNFSVRSSSKTFQHQDEPCRHRSGNIRTNHSMLAIAFSIFNDPEFNCFQIIFKKNKNVCNSEISSRSHSKQFLIMFVMFKVLQRGSPRNRHPSPSRFCIDFSFLHSNFKLRMDTSDNIICM